MRPVRITLEDGTVAERPALTPISTLMRAAADADGLPFIAALVNNEAVSLCYPIAADAAVRFVTGANPHGWRIYCNSVAFLAAACARRLFPDGRFALEHSIGPGLYCTIESREGADRALSEAQVAALEELMRRTVAQDLPIERQKVSFADAVERLKGAGQTDKLNLLTYRNQPRIVVHWCGDFHDLAHGPLAPSTGVLRWFRLIPYPPGFVLQLPEPTAPAAVPEFRDQPHLFHILQEHKAWGRILGMRTVGRLNELVAGGRAGEMIRISEALHEKKIVRIADEIARRRGQVKIVLIAGPSSAGKTTFSKRLSIQLQVNGLRPVTLSTDDYFVDDARTPRDENGERDFEHIATIDLETLHAHLAALLRGEEAAVPRFDFTRRCSVPAHRRLRLERDDILMVEGIHGLNPELTRSVPQQNKFRIYINALTQLAVDSNNRISTRDNRLVRRLVRDSKFRNNSPLDTLRMWPSVRRGEERWIFPFQAEADATFNSALDYELAVLKAPAELLLSQVKPTVAEYAEARRLTAFLLNFLPVRDAEVPETSILREFIGGSVFAY